MAKIRPIFGSSVLTGICVMLCLVAAMLVYNHVHIIIAARGTTVPNLAAVLELEQTREALHSQKQLEELQHALETDVLEQQVEAFVLPKEIDIDRTVALFDALQQYFTLHGLANGDAGSIVLHTDVAPPVITIDVPMHNRAIHLLLNIIESAGIMTVYDALPITQREALLHYTEVHNPNALPDLEQFFGLSLLEYGADADMYIRRLERSYADPAFANLITIALQSPYMQTAATIFSGSLGELISQNNLWPLPFMQLESFTMQASTVPDWHQTNWQIRVANSR